MSGTGPRLHALRLVGGGRCIAHLDGRTWMVAGALPGELVEVEVERERARVIEARAVSLIEAPHPAREPAPCPHADLCGGCDWPHVQAAAGAALKAEMAAGAARATPALAARLAAAPVRPSALAYRLRARLHWSPERAVLGLYARRSHEPTAIPECRLLSPALTRALPGLREALTASCPVRVDVEWLEGLDGSTRVAALRPGRGGPAAVAQGWVPDPQRLEGLVDGLHRLDRDGRLQRGWGPAGVTMQLPVPLQVPIGAFFQGNRHLVPWLFDKVAEYAGEEPLPTWDLHAGVGFLAAAATATATSAAGIPLVLAETFVPAALSARTSLPAATVAVGQSAEEVLGRARHLPRASLAILDPPRVGLSRRLRAQLAAWKPRRILMLSCDPATWARDTADLISHGYQLSRIELIDLFASTHHVEVLSLLEAE